MAKLDGVLKFKGRVGEVTMWKGADGYQARTKTGMDGNRVKLDPRFERTRENASEFGRAGVGSRVLRTAIAPLLRLASDKRVTSRLTQVMMKVLQADPVSIRGQRNLTNGNPELLRGFEFNIDARLVSAFNPPLAPSIDRVNGVWQVDIPAFIPDDHVSKPEGATHFKLKAAGFEIDFDQQTYDVSIAETQLIPYSREEQEPIQLTEALPPNSTKHLFIIFGIEFFQLVNGLQYALKSGQFNALTMAEVERGS